MGAKVLQLSFALLHQRFQLLYGAALWLEAVDKGSVMQYRQTCQQTRHHADSLVAHSSQVEIEIDQSQKETYRFRLFSPQKEVNHFNALIFSNWARKCIGLM